jgi:hypothetical protein
MEGQQIGVETRRRGQLEPVAKRNLWIAAGLTLQVIGVAMPVAYLVEKARKEDLGGHISRATLRLAWRQALQSHAGLALMIGGVLVFVSGAVVLARPFAKSWLTLAVAVPIAAVVGLLVLGAAVLIVVVIAAIVASLFDSGSGGGGGGSGDWWWWSSSSSGRRRRKADDEGGGILDNLQAASQQREDD